MKYNYVEPVAFCPFVFDEAIGSSESFVVLFNQFLYLSTQPQVPEIVEVVYIVLLS